MKRARAVSPGRPKPREPTGDLAIYVALFLVVFCAYIQVHSFDFIKYDDDEFVVNNTHLRDGLTIHALRWAFQSLYAANWFPLTWISYMLGYQLYGLNSGWHHLTNVALHAVSTLLLYGVLKRMTGARRRSAFVAFVFAIHPLHVEPVAWVAERKEVLSGVFWFLTIWAYVRYTNRPTIRAYLLTAAMFCLGLMSKPMIVTLPFVLLLLDIWPLRRWPPTRRSIAEKLPLLLLSAGASAITLVAQHRGGAVSSLDLIPVTLRIQNALTSYAIYVLKFLWPTDVSIIYPLQIDIPVWQAAGAAVVLFAVTAFALLQFRQRAYIAVGWLWFMGTLVPVIGLIQVGAQSRADRYTYIPFIGLSIAAAWGFAELAGRWKPVKIAAPIAACSVLFTMTFIDIGYWRNSVSIFEHAIAVTGDNWIAQNGLAQGLLSDGRIPEAMLHAQESLRLNPKVAESHVILGDALNRSDRLDEAETQFDAAVRLRPDNADAQEGLGMVLTEEAHFQEALGHLLEAVRLRPDDGDSHYNLGRLYGFSGKTDQAIAQFTEAARIKPNEPWIHYNLATALAVAGRVDEGIAEFRLALQLKPDYTEAHLTLARLFASLDRCKESAVELREVLRLEPESAEALELLDRCRP